MAYTTIDDPEAYFQTVLYTGNGSANNAITLPGDTDMQPDVVWIKNRDQTDSHCFFDSLRGATEVHHTDGYAASATDADTLDSFTSDGFQVDADVKVNTNTEAYVAWCWKESATAGFDMVAYTGDGNTSKNVSHSLSAVPHLMIVKGDSVADGWQVYHHKNTSAPETDMLELNQTSATLDRDTRWNDTAPTSSVFTVGTTSNTNSGTFIGYLWTEKQGFSKFGSYTGNGGNNFIYTGFRPAFLMCKQTSGVANWQIYNNKVSSFNQGSGEYTIRANASTAEGSAGTYEVDLLSNGFRPVGSSSSFNSSGASYIYMAFAEAPFVNSNGVPCNAR